MQVTLAVLAAVAGIVRWSLAAVDTWLYGAALIFSVISIHRGFTHYRRTPSMQLPG
jgi:hypothetical protein